MNYFGKSSLLLLCVVLAVLCVASDGKKGLGARKFSKLHRIPKFPLISKIRHAVMPSSSPPPSDTEQPPKMKEEEWQEVAEAQVKASGVRVVPVRSAPPPPVDCGDNAPDNVYSCAEQKAFGKCGADFMLDGNYCAKTCGRPPCPPVDDDDFCPSIAEGVEGSSLLSILDLALEVGGVKEALDDPDLRVTVIAPTNSAFEKLFNDLNLSADQFLDYPEVIGEILSVHVLTEPLVFGDVSPGQKYETLSESSFVQFSENAAGDLFVMGAYGMPAKVISTDLDACGSIVHVIDTVLIPDSDVLESLNLSESIIMSYTSTAQKMRG